MTRNLNRLSAAANRQAAHHDFMHVYTQLKQYKPPYTWPEKDSAKEIDKLTRSLITWARDNGIEIILPEGWS